MKNYDMRNIRNIAFLGASGAGKTTLIEQMLFDSKATTRVGKVEDGNTVMDFDAEEIAKGMSISLTIGNLTWKKNRINIIDTPGYADYLGESLTALSAVESVLLVANAAGGFEVGLEQAFGNIGKKEIVKGIVINRMDNEHADYDKVLDLIQENLEITFAPIHIPIGKENQFRGVVDLVKGKAFLNGELTDIPADMTDIVEEYRLKLMESVAETDDNLLEKYFEEGELSEEELALGVKNGIKNKKLIPVFACSAKTNVGIDALLDAIIEYLPSPAATPEVTIIEDEEEKKVVTSPDNDLIAYIFKSYSDPNLGDMAYVRVFSGTLKSGMEVRVPEKNGKDKIGGIYDIQGKNRSDSSELKAGEIGGLVKLKTARGLNSIIAPNLDCKFPTPILPSPVFWKSIKAANQSDEDKIGTALSKLLEEDPTINSTFDQETAQMVLSGQGEQQIGLIKKRLKSRFKVEADLYDPKIPYRETINGKSDVSYKHKKQSGGRGQFGNVSIRISAQPRGEGFKFINSIVGGVIPSKFIPAVEKGCRETLVKGIIAGYRVVDVCCDLYFGSYHDVDSSELAFKIAASQALKIGFNQAKPILLEPIHEIEIIIPNEYMGDVMGDLSTRRGKIMGMEQKGKKQILKAQLPLSELYGYFTSLKSLTQGRGRFIQDFSHFEKVPDDIALKVIEAFKSDDE